MGRIRDKLSDAILGAPENANANSLDSVVRRGSVGLRIRALRQMGVRPGLDPNDCLLRGLVDPVPGVRRAAGWALGQRSVPRAAERLLQVATDERCDPVRWTLSVAAVRCGLPVEVAWAVVKAAAGRTLHTWYGPRQPAAVIGAGEGEASLYWTACLQPGAAESGSATAAPADALRAQALRACHDDPDDRQALLDLSVHQHPEDYALLSERLNHQGRRMRHAVTDALGIHGDPRSIPALLRILKAVDVDPGHGFASRARAAAALGRIGIPGVARHLVHALEDEAMDHEGRPGAGLGIQTPVRVAVLTALGDVGARRQAKRLAEYLGNTSGTAGGGFYLPAMDALWKLDAVDVVRPLLDSAEMIVANALGVLRAAGRPAAVAAFANDPRPRVAAVARLD